VRAYDRGDLSFSWYPEQDDQAFVVAGDGSRWRVTDIGLQKVGGGGFLTRLPGHLAYWFGWYAFYPDTELWTGS
jgi:hypothetical protein